MFRVALTAAAAVALVIGGAVPATAATTAPAAKAPGAPVSVAVTGEAGSAIVTWRAPRAGATVTGWRVAVTPAEQQADKGVDTLPATTRSDRFDHLTPNTAYTFSVRAVSARGTGAAVSVKYTAPASGRTTQSLFAIDAAGAVERFPVSGSAAPTTVVRNGPGFTADVLGDVFVPSTDRTAIIMYPADGGAARPVAIGLRVGADLRSDVAGNLYYVDARTGAVVKVPAAGTAPTVVLKSSGTAWTVGRDGTVSAVTFGTQGLATKVVQVSPRGVSTTRSIPENGYQNFGGVLADGSGNLFLNYTSTGASGASWWSELARGSSTLVDVAERIAFEYAGTNSSGLLVGRSAEWCAAPNEARPGGCGVDKTVTSVLQRRGDGTTSERTTSGVTAEGRGVHVGAADECGDLFFDVASGATPGLWRLGSDGGAAQQLSSGQFTRLLVI